METKVILKYKREYECWLCPECDTENNMTSGSCHVCNCKRPSAVVVLKPWNEVYNRATPEPVKYKPGPETKESTSVFKDDGYIPPAKKPKEKKHSWLVIAAILLILFLLGLLADNGAFACSTEMQVINTSFFCCGSIVTGNEARHAELKCRDFIDGNSTITAPVARNGETVGIISG